MVNIFDSFTATLFEKDFKAYCSMHIVNIGNHMLYLYKKSIVISRIL